MAQIIRVTPEELRTAAKDIRQKAGDYQTKYKSVLAKVNELSTAWTGKDNTEYKTKVEGFGPDLETMYNWMIAYAEFLENAAKTYDETQESLRQQATRLSN